MCDCIEYSFVQNCRWKPSVFILEGLHDTVLMQKVVIYWWKHYRQIIFDSDTINVLTMWTKMSCRFYSSKLAFEWGVIFLGFNFLVLHYSARMWKVIAKQKEHSYAEENNLYHLFNWYNIVGNPSPLDNIMETRIQTYANLIKCQVKLTKAQRIQWAQYVKYRLSIAYNT